MNFTKPTVRVIQSFLLTSLIGSQSALAAKTGAVGLHLKLKDHMNRFVGDNATPKRVDEAVTDLLRRVYQTESDSVLSSNKGITLEGKINLVVERLRNLDLGPKSSDEAKATLLQALEIAYRNPKNRSKGLLTRNSKRYINSIIQISDFFLEFAEYGKKTSPDEAGSQKINQRQEYLANKAFVAAMTGGELTVVSPPLKFRTKYLSGIEVNQKMMENFNEDYIKSLKKRTVGDTATLEGESTSWNNTYEVERLTVAILKEENVAGPVARVAAMKKVFLPDADLNDPRELEKLFKRNKEMSDCGGK